MTTVVDGLAYPECPRWHDGTLWLSDQHAGVVLRVGADGVPVTVAEVPGGPAGLTWLPDGALLVVSMHDRRLLALDTPADDGPPVVRPVAELGALHPGLSNELVCDPVGRAYVGNIGFDYYGGEAPRPTVLAMVESGSVRAIVDDLLVPNGMVIDGRVLVVAESFAHRLTAFDIGEDGGLHGRRVHADLGSDIPDGICLDAEGAIWYAAIGRHEVVRVLPGGRVTDRVATGDREAVACVLGGDNLDILFICTTADLDPGRSVAVRSGRVEAVTVEVPARAQL